MLAERGMVQKRCFYEWSSRIPFIVSFPARFAGGRTCDTPVSLVDVLPTVCDVVGAGEPLARDGCSLVPILEGGSLAARPVFSEFHAEGVLATCFMNRSDRYKYVYVHGHDEQLFDLASDPAEWTNLVDRREVADVRDELRAQLLERFDPDALEADIERSIAARKLIREAMRLNRTRWDYFPVFDATTQYWRSD
jgi:choline-sulfatase